MRLHTDDLTHSDLLTAVDAAGLHSSNLTVREHRSRSRSRAFNVYLTGTSSRRPNSASGDYAHDDYAATWDEWGMFLADLYRRDPRMVVGSPGSPIYADVDDFHAITCDRYRTLTPAQQHGRAGHRWEVATPGLDITCKTCDAMREHPAETARRRNQEV